MEFDLDRTQEWLNRTQDIHRQPAVRAGQPEDRRSRRQTFGSMTAVILALLAIFLIPRPIAPIPSGPAESEAARPSTPALLSAHAAPIRALIDSEVLLPMPTNWSKTLRPAIVRPDSGEWYAPVAPIWLETHPRDWATSSLAAGASPIPAMRSAGDLIGH